MKKVLLSLLAITVISISSQAQQIIPCATDEALDNLHKQFPQLKAEYDAQLLLQNSALITSKNGTKAISYQVPVVFHILHEYGAENVSDANVYAVMNQLNEHYSASNADLSLVVPAFDTLIGDAEIQFKLAAIDPLGNCTNGIEHIYSHETKVGDVYSKINQWNRSRYMNIWVVNTPNSGGETAGTLLGYATFPAGTDGNGYWTDGIVLRDWTVSGTDRTLTHEAGHYLGLSHPFAGTSAGDGACGDDGVEDTPPTDGSFSTCNVALANCNSPIIENVQNFMDYSSCTYMFTPGQVSVMHNTINGIAGERNNLWTDSTLGLTGIKDLGIPQIPSNSINNLTVPLCAPIADFHSAQKTTCVGDLMTFSDASWNAVIDSRLWTFQDGSPATSTSPNPTISFTSPGYKTVTLQSTNAAGTGTETRTGYIYVYPNWADFNGPVSLNLENHYASWFRVNNIEENDAKFQISNNGGINNSKAFKLNNYKDVTNADLFTNDYFYNNRLGLSVDELITPSFDFRYTTGISVSFKYALATNAVDAADVTETLKVYSSRNCGKTWSLKKSIPASQIVTAGFAGFTDFTPSSNSQYQESNFTYIPSSADSKTIFKFVFEASDISSNLFIDDINITGTLSLTSDVISVMDLNVFPNPTSNGNAINISYQGQDQAVTFTLRNAQGKEISSETIEATNTTVERTLNGTQDLSAACYFLEISTGDHSTTRKVIVL